MSLRESAQTAFTTMLGSGEAASKMIGDLYTFAKKTPFKFDGMMQSAQQLISMGMAAENVIPTLTAVGDAAAASGKVGGVRRHHRRPRQDAGPGAGVP
ncbi:MAG: hypothetical protein ACLR3C_13525 [Eggerthella lenta]